MSARGREICVVKYKSCVGKFLACNQISTLVLRHRHPGKIFHVSDQNLAIAWTKTYAGTNNVLLIKQKGAANLVSSRQKTKKAVIKLG